MQEESWDGAAEDLSLLCQPGMASAKHMPGDLTESQMCGFIMSTINPARSPRSNQTSRELPPREKTAMAPRNENWKFQSVGNARLKMHQEEKKCLPGTE